MTKTWGPFTLERTDIPDNDSSLSATDREGVFPVTVFDCFPPPGSTEQKPRRNPLRLRLVVGSLQDVERRRLRLMPTVSGGPAGAAGRIRSAIYAKLEFEMMEVDYDNEGYRRLRGHHDCFTSTIYIRVKYKVSEVKVTATESLRLGGETFSAGDPIATYRVGEPQRYRFEVHHLWNPRCCPDKPAEEKASERTDYYWPLPELEEIDIMPPKKRDLWRIEAEYRYNDLFRFRWQQRYRDDD